jgi:hypothetical protein
MYTEMQICISLCNINSCTCYKVCSIQTVEVVLTTRRNLIFLELPMTRCDINVTLPA